MTCRAIADRIYNQYRTKPKALSWYQITEELACQIADAYEEVRLSYDIDNATTYELDVLGTIVVIDREFIANVPLPTYQCNIDGDNESGDDEIQCSALSIADDQELSNDYYRPLIRAKIEKNNSDATIDGILRAINTIAPDIDVLRVIDNEDMSFSIEFYGLADPIIRDLLVAGDIIPKPQGVRFNGFLEGFDITECGEDEKMCGDESAECVGFIGT